MEHLQTHRSFVSYIDRTREYYAAQGYPKAYAWPRYDDVPFTPLRKASSECRVGLVTTAGKPQAEVKTRLLGVGVGSAGVVCGTDEPPTDPSIYGRSGLGQRSDPHRGH